jgi:23S rRNA (cytidine1920-2'-O)/16S rRNA (cytidine1409-2'-O)-methyltransferase
MAVGAGRVLVSGRPAGKPGTMVAGADPIVFTGPARKFVSRGGDKLDAALDRFEVDVAGRRDPRRGCLDRGFTDCLLSRGASAVVAVDVGYGQLDWGLRTDARVTVLTANERPEPWAGDAALPPGGRDRRRVVHLPGRSWYPRWCAVPRTRPTSCSS